MTEVAILFIGFWFGTLFGVALVRPRQTGLLAGRLASYVAPRTRLAASYRRDRQRALTAKRNHEFTYRESLVDRIPTTSSVADDAPDRPARVSKASMRGSANEL